MPRVAPGRIYRPDFVLALFVALATRCSQSVRNTLQFGYGRASQVGISAVIAKHQQALRDPVLLHRGDFVMAIC